MSMHDQWWYYTVQASENEWHQGIYEDDMVLLPRLNLSKVDIADQTVLDVATMEGLMPVLMAKAGARKVVAVDFERPGAPSEGTDSIPANFNKLDYIRRLHSVNYDFHVVPERETTFDSLTRVGANQFDFLNLSGLLYHVFSPMHWLGSIRGLIKQGGLSIISTNVVCTSDMVMEFNDRGRLQGNLTTYWYLSVPFMDYLLRYFRLRPVRAEFFPYPGANTGYLSVVCRAEESVISASGDSWMENSAWHSWDSKWYGGHNPSGYEQSAIQFKDGNEFDARDVDLNLLSVDLHGKPWLNLSEFVEKGTRQSFLGNSSFTARLGLSDFE